MPRSDFKFRHRMRVRYAEVDPQRIVFNTRYLEYFDVGITEYFRVVGIHGQQDAEDAEFHVARNVIDYKKPLRSDELFDVLLRCARIGNSSMTYEWEIHGFDKGERDDDLRALGQSVSVHVGELGHGPSPVPPRIVQLFETFEERTLKTMEKAA